MNNNNYLHEIKRKYKKDHSDERISKIARR